MDILSDEVRIDGALCYRIDEEDLDFIITNQTNNYSPSSGYPYTIEPSSNCIITSNDFVGYGGFQEGP